MRFASLGLIDGFSADLIVSGINHGSNLGDDITYSGTVAAALEGVVLGIPAIAVSQQSIAREMDFRLGDRFDFEARRARSPRGSWRRSTTSRCPTGTLLNVNVPGRRARGRRGRAARQAHLPRPARRSIEEDVGGRKRYRIYGDAPDHHDERRAPTSPPIAAGRIAVTPLHFDLTDRARASRRCSAYDLARLLAPAAREVE